MRFGLQIPNFTFDAPVEQTFDEIVALARAAEETGFESVWVMDHFYQLPPLGGPAMPMLEAYTLLGGLAARTERVKLGTLVTGVTYRNPALLGKEIVTLDVMSKGRAIAGIGAAWFDVEHTAFGVDFPGARERLDRLEEAAQILRGMFTQESFTFDGTYYRTHELRTVPAPVTPGGPPIMIGGGGEKRTLKLVAQYADMCNFQGSPEVTARKIDVLRSHCEAVGRDPNDVTITRMSTMFITDSDEQTASTKEFLVGAAGAEAAAGYQVGTEDEIVDQIAELAKMGVEYFIFNMPMGGVDDVRRAGELLSRAFG